MDRYFLSEQVDDFTFKGFLKATKYCPIGRKYKSSILSDSTKVYRTVEIKFRNKKYDSYVITIKNQDD